MNGFEETMDGLAAVALASYLAAVVLKGNTNGFLKLALQETGFLEFLIAIFLLYQLGQVQALKPFTGPLITAAGVILIFRLISGADMSAFNDFSAGKIGLFELVSRTFNPKA